MKRTIGVYLVLAGLLFASTVQAGGTLNKQQLKALEDADIYFEIGDYHTALGVYNQLYEVDSSYKQLSYKIGVCLYQLREPMKAEPYLEHAKRKGEKEAYYYLSAIYHLKEEFDAEIALLQQYKNFNIEHEVPLERVNKLIESANYAKDLMRKPGNVDIVNAGAVVNSTHHEYAPLVYGPENELFFTSRRPQTTGGKQDPNGAYFEDIYRSIKESGYWTAPEPLNENINTATNDASVGISQDGQILYLFRTNDDLVSGDLYESRLTADGWGVPKKLGPEINSNYVESSASISNDERVLYFSSNRPGGYGGKDIYRVVKLPTGNWSKAQNLGPTINTPYDEDAPFIHVDNKSLYFSSNGHKTMGGYDIFVSELGENGMWSEPLNMGYPVNTVANDLYFVMSPDKQNGYYSSAQGGGFGGQDIYVITFKLYAEILSVVKGGVFAGSGASIPVGAKVTLIDSETRDIQGIYKANEKNGRFIMVIAPERSYTMIVEADGYHTYSEEVSFGPESLFSSSISEIKLVPTEVAKHE
jgi:tetratricopeptide (TPR) repeat protein